MKTIIQEILVKTLEVMAKNREIFYKSELNGNRLNPDISPTFNPEFDYEVLWPKH